MRESQGTYITKFLAVTTNLLEGENTKALNGSPAHPMPFRHISGARFLITQLTASQSPPSGSAKDNQQQAAAQSGIAFIEIRSAGVDDPRAVITRYAPEIQQMRELRGSGFDRTPVLGSESTPAPERGDAAEIYHLDFSRVPAVEICPVDVRPERAAAVRITLSGIQMTFETKGETSFGIFIATHSSQPLGSRQLPFSTRILKV
ncbi:hypothetical protein BDM02DRAFT_3130087 [Thelephora ganbajun]|uniref:Uncharacterized protein n=1 Tax=Thelephora ganbajun TaxID=370292 RepID=A0ACB6ZC12_THEGA|nr:hypothetical protein BDM02DRAFT_3130087 [Thelephora ganbajun]